MFPHFFGRPRWVDKKTFAWRMRLEPNHDYWLSINNANFRNFSSAKDESAEPYEIAFKTAAGEVKRDITEDNRIAVEVLQQGIDDDYSYRDRLKIDWAARFSEWEPKLIATKTPEAFADEAAKLLSAAQDVHITLSYPNNRIGTHSTGTAPNFNKVVLRRVVPGWTQHEGGVATGKFDDGVAYALIPEWSENQKQGLEEVFALIGKSEKIILDVRPNGGGDELLAREVAGCFVSEPKVYSKNTIRRAGKTSEPYDRIVEPNAARPAFKGKIVVLMGPKNVSSNESFLLMMRAGGATLVGDRSYGSSGNPKPLDLGNDVTVYLPSWVDMMPDGTELEGKGVTPDVVIKTTPEEFKDADPILQKAREIVQK
jgi:hypothetical protein